MTKNHFLQLFCCLIISFVLSVGCSQRVNLDRSYSNSFRAIFVLQGQARSNSITPLTADDSKAILTRRKNKGSQKSGMSSKKSSQLSNTPDLSSLLSAQ